MVASSKWVAAGQETEGKEAYFMDYFDNRVTNLSEAYFFDNEEIAALYCDASQENVKPVKVNIIYSLDVAI